MTINGLEVRLTRHALQRYIERVRPGLTEGQALKELVELVRGGRVLQNAPAWLREVPEDAEATTHMRRAATSWCELSDGIIACLSRNGRVCWVTTILTRGSRSESVRSDRSNRRRQRNALDRDFREARRRSALAARSRHNSLRKDSER